MTEANDPKLSELFLTDSNDLRDPKFTHQVMSQVDNRSKRIVLTRILIVVLIVTFEAIFSAPVQGLVGDAVDSLSTPLLDLDDAWYTFIVSPINSPAGLIGALLLLLHTLYHKVIH